SHNPSTSAGLNVAARPRDPGPIELFPPAPALNSALESEPWRGSELLFAGMPSPVHSAKAWILLFQRAAVSGLSSVVARICLKLSFERNSICSSVKSQGLAPLSSYTFPSYVPANQPLLPAGIAWCLLYNISPAIC